MSDNTKVKLLTMVAKTLEDKLTQELELQRDISHRNGNYTGAAWYDGQAHAYVDAVARMMRILDEA